MQMIDDKTRTRVVGSTTAFSAGGTAFGGALALVVNEAFRLPFSESGVLALGIIFSTLGAVLGGWLAPSKKAETESYLGSVLAMAQYGDHGKLATVPVVGAPVVSSELVSNPAVEEVQEEPPVLVATDDTEFTDPAYAQPSGSVPA